MKSKSKLLLDIREELKRFSDRLDVAIEETTESGYTSFGPSKKFAAAKRAALDLKNELTKLTQSSKYLYD